MAIYNKSLFWNITLVSVMALGISGCDKRQPDASTTMDEPMAAVASGVTDSELEHQINLALTEQQSLSNTHIMVSAASGTVNLSGTVQSKSQHDQIMELVNKIDGVTKIDDKLTVAEQP